MGVDAGGGSGLVATIVRGLRRSTLDGRGHNSVGPPRGAAVSRPCRCSTLFGLPVLASVAKVAIMP